MNLFLAIPCDFLFFFVMATSGLTFVCDSWRETTKVSGGPKRGITKNVKNQAKGIKCFNDLKSEFTSAKSQPNANENDKCLI